MFRTLQSTEKKERAFVSTFRRSGNTEINASIFKNI